MCGRARAGLGRRVSAHYGERRETHPGGDERPYDVGISLMGQLGPVLTEADYAGAAYSMWGFLTDGIDGPPRYAPGLSEAETEDLMRLAASE